VMIDHGVEPFDVTRLPDVDIEMPIEGRDAGGLGLHLIRRMADSIEYDYDVQQRESRITVRYSVAGLAERRP
jgi:anti-sigma regulatory factor (Ser/Thr protein kinase)